jgi:FAM32A
MPSDDYISTPSTGKLKLKGVKDSKVTKKKKPKPAPKDEKPAAEDTPDTSIMLKKLEDEDREMRKEESKNSNEAEDGDERPQQELGVLIKTEAERRYDEQRRKRVCHSSPLHTHSLSPSTRTLPSQSTWQR